MLRVEIVGGRRESGLIAQFPELRRDGLRRDRLRFGDGCDTIQTFRVLRVTAYMGEGRTIYTNGIM